MTTSAPAAARNPFATRHTRPGRLVPRTPGGEPLELAGLLERARELGAAAIVGRHGSGKTNLLVSLARLLDEAGLHAATVRPRTWGDGAAVLRAVLRARSGTTLCVDSWEALGRPWARLVRWIARGRGVVLIVTTHDPAGLPRLVRCDTTAALLARLVEALPGHGGRITAEDVGQAFAAAGGDIREALYDLYDRFERRGRSA